MKKRVLSIILSVIVFILLFTVIVVANEQDVDRLIMPELTQIDYNDDSFDITWPENQLYTGEELTPKPVIKFGDFTLEEGKDYTVSYENNIGPSYFEWAKITVQFQGDYNGTVSEYFDIRTVWQELQRAVSSGYNVSAGKEYISEVYSEIDGVTTVTLLKDIPMTEFDTEGVSIKGISNKVILDLNGHTIDRNKTEIFVIESAELTLCDSSDAKNGKIVNGLANYGGAIKITQGGKLTVENGTISNCRAKYGGGAIYAESGDVVISGGTITECSASEAGGAISMKNGNLTMSGGTISKCYASSVGGGVNVDRGTFKMTGGYIIENQARNNSYGGGVYLDSTNGIFIMTGGFITNNTTLYANNFGAGVSSGKSVTIGGTAVIENNLKGVSLGMERGTADDLYISSSRPISIAIGEDSPVEGMHVGVAMIKNGHSIAGAFTQNCDSDLSEYFFSDDISLETKYLNACMELSVKEMTVEKSEGVVSTTFYSLEEKEVIFYLAVYDENGKMCGIASKTITINHGANSVSMDLPSEPYSEGIVFALNKDTASPLCKEVDF